jgi:hypothetical protein
MINMKTYSVNNVSLTPEILERYINDFWTEVFYEIKDNSYLMVLCKVQFINIDQGYKTLGHLVKANFEDKEIFTDYLTQRLSILSDSYVTVPICQITFSYVIKSGKCEDSDRTLLSDLTDKELGFHNFNNMNLPITMDPFKYGIVEVSKIIEENGNTFERFIVTNNNKTYRIDVYNNGINKVTILGSIKLSWIDTKIDSDFFKREIKKSTIYFMDGEVILRKKELNYKPFKKLSKTINLINEFYTMDIETITEKVSETNKKVRPYLINAYNGRQHINNFNPDENELFKGFMDKLLSNLDKGSHTIIYAHNLSTFDGVLILKHLFQYGKVEPMLFNGRLISIKLKIYGIGRPRTIEFKDSILLLPYSLRNLGQSFNVTVTKGHFPFELTDIYYTGVFPAFNYWTNITLQEWYKLKLEYGKRMWSFQAESIKYCEKDCASLHEILIKFNELIFNKFKVDVHKSLTLPALAMRIYKTNYMPENSIYQLSGLPEFNMRQSYSGGAVDVYIPHNITSGLDNISSFNKDRSKKRRLYGYDVNSLFPYIMAEYSMPIGKPIAFLGNIRKVDPDAYGIFYCNITSPTFMQNPILQRRVKTNNGMRTIAGLGSWDGWICSSEMDNAMKFGYQFKIIKGYQFKKGNIFKDYVTKMYNLRIESPRKYLLMRGGQMS